MKTWPYYSPECRREVDALLKKGGSLSAYRANKNVGVGPREGSEAWKLEREIERKFRVKHAVAVNSGTAALHAALVAIGVSGRDVVVSPYTFSATCSAILLAGGRPVFSDVDPYTFCITKETVKRVITKRTAAILPVDLFGLMADVDGLKEFDRPIISDSCQAVGAGRDGKYSGTVADAGVYSFNGSKNIPAGEGGCLVTNDTRIANKARLFINHQENFGLKEVSPNYRIQEVVALIARHGLKELEERNQRRVDLMSVLYSELCHLTWDNKQLPFLQLTTHQKGECVYYVYPFTVNNIDRSLFIKRMKRHGITVGAGYITPPLHHYPAFKKYATLELPVVDELSSKTLCLLYCLTPEKPLSYAKKVAGAIRESLD